MKLIIILICLLFLTGCCMARYYAPFSFSYYNNSLSKKEMHGTTSEPRDWYVIDINDTREDK